MMSLVVAPIGAVLALAVILRLIKKVSIPFAYQYRLYISPLGYYFNLRGEVDKPHSQTSPTESKGFKIAPVAIRSDNYAYLIIDKTTSQAVAIDPSDPKVVLEALKAEGATLAAIFTTHKHWDHSGGNHRLLLQYPTLRIYGSALDTVPSANQKVYDGEVIAFGSLRFKAFECRVHTKGHLLFLLDPALSQVADHPPVLFTGDALFVGGAGKFFESTAAEFLALVERLRGLDPRTLIFPGHEITLQNLQFAEFIDPRNGAVKAKLEWAKSRRAELLQTIPSTLQEEFTYNPFLRSNSQAIRENLPPPRSPSAGPEQEAAHYVREVREAKDNFVPKTEVSLEKGSK